MSNIDEEVYKEKIIKTISVYAIPGLKLDGYIFIRDLVCKELRVHKDHVFRRSRKRKYVFARQVMMFLAHLSFKYETLSNIGDAFGGYDHATVLHSKRSVTDLISYDKHLHRTVMHLVDEVNTVKGRFTQHTNGKHNKYGKRKPYSKKATTV